MVVNFDGRTMILVAETSLEKAYIEEVLGAKEEGDTITLSRKTYYTDTTYVPGTTLWELRSVDKEKK